MVLEGVLWVLLGLVFVGSAWYNPRSRNDVMFRALSGLCFVVSGTLQYLGYALTPTTAAVTGAIALLAFYFGYRSIREHGPSKGLQTWWRWLRGSDDERGSGERDSDR